MAETVKLFNYLQPNTATIMADLPGGTPDHAKVLAAVKAVPDEDESGASIHKDFDHLGSKYYAGVHRARVFPGLFFV